LRQTLDLALAGDVPLLPWTRAAAVHLADADVDIRTLVVVEAALDLSAEVDRALLDHFRRLADDAGGARTLKFVERYGPLSFTPDGSPAASDPDESELRQPLDFYRWSARLLDVALQTFNRAKEIHSFTGQRSAMSSAAGAAHAAVEELHSLLAEHQYDWARMQLGAAASLFSLFMEPRNLGRLFEPGDHFIAAEKPPSDVLGASIVNLLFECAGVAPKVYWPADRPFGRVAFDGGLWAAIAFRVAEEVLGGSFSKVCDICQRPPIEPPRRHRKGGQAAYCGRPECERERKRRHRAKRR